MRGTKRKLGGAISRFMWFIAGTCHESRTCAMPLRMARLDVGCRERGPCEARAGADTQLGGALYDSSHAIFTG